MSFPVKERLGTIMKKMLAMTLALTMSALVFASCGDTADESKADATTTTTTTAAEESVAEEESSAAEDSVAEAESSAAEAESEAEAEPAESTAEGEGEGESEGPAEFDITKVEGYDEAATETVIELPDQISDAWANGLGTYSFDEVSGDNFIDGRTFDRDKDVHMVVEFEYTETFNKMIEDAATDQHKTQIVIGPSHANGWTKFGETFEGLVTDYPAVNDPNLTEYVVANGEDLATPETKSNKPKGEQVWPDVFVKGDGFIKIGNHDVKSIEFTIPAEQINALIDNSTPDPEDPEKWGNGILFQIGGNMYITKITIDQGNVFLKSQIVESGMA